MIGGGEQRIPGGAEIARGRAGAGSPWRALVEHQDRRVEAPGRGLEQAVGDEDPGAQRGGELESEPAARGGGEASPRSRRRAMRARRASRGSTVWDLNQNHFGNRRSDPLPLLFSLPISVSPENGVCCDMSHGALACAPCALVSVGRAQ